MAGVGIADRTGFGIMRCDSNLQHFTGFGADRQERAVTGAAFLTKCRQDDIGDRIVMAQHCQQGVIELA